MSTLIVLGHVTPLEIPQLSLYVLFGFLLGISVTLVLREGKTTDDNDDQ
jgi:uncharacterized membrane-anchored protein YitT (DUF2179 family)